VGGSVRTGVVVEVDVDMGIGTANRACSHHTGVRRTPWPAGVACSGGSFV
jgi:hypothetical protein